MTNLKVMKVQKIRNNEYYNLQTLFDTLYTQSKQGSKFNKLIPLIVSEENIKLAYRNIKSNKGSKTPGVDKRTIRYYKNFSEENFVKHIKKCIEWYTPNKIRRIEIPKGNGRTRPLGIPTMRDRIIQQCIVQVLEPICEAKFHERSNGFRPNRSAEHAIAQAMTMIQQRKLFYVIDIDIKGFFDNVSHGKLLKQLWSIGIQDKKLLSILSTMLKAEIATIGFPEKGTPQGSIISPLLSNVVLNELDWWIASQWEEIPTHHNYKCNVHSNGTINKNPIYSALRKTKLKECYIVRYADDFKLFCRNYNDAKKLFYATRQWLKERLNLDINTDKSKIVNLKTNYSEFLGFKMKAKKKGKIDGKNKYVVTSHISDKAKDRIFKKAKQTVENMAHADCEYSTYKIIGLYNAYVMGVHNYYRLATEVNKDFHEISFHINRTCKRKLKKRLKRTSNKQTQNVITIRYGKSKELRYVNDRAIIPIGYVQHKKPMWKKTSINKYTKEGRNQIHKEIDTASIEVVHYLMKNPIQSRSIEYNDNRLSLYSAQKGKCSITHKVLGVDEIHCHHKTPICLGGNDDYSNLTIIHVFVHRLIHAKTLETINQLLEYLQLTPKQLEKVNVLRKLCELEQI